jgi:hypothetical protein
MSFFTMPSNRGLQRAASNHAHEQLVIVFRGFVRVRRFEAAYRLVLLRPALAREYTNMIMVRKDYSVRSSKPNPCMPGLGQGHGKKRHLRALFQISSLTRLNYGSTSSQGNEFSQFKIG